MVNTVLKVFSNEKREPIKRMNGVGGGPVTANFTYDASAFFKEARIPFSRTHDIEYPFGAGEFVDIHNIFPDFDKDENDPASYNFTLTDEYIKCIVAAGTKPFYRLGNSIEHQPIKRHVHPPRDFQKWGRVCSRIIAHLNEGWADGHHFGIEYFEIWNEPENYTCWTGTYDQIIALYDAAANIIKKDHPNAKIGGLSLASPKSKLLDRLLSHCKECHTPLDFVSWHAYVSNPDDIAVMAKDVRNKLNEYGFDSCESVFNEWNYVYSWTSGFDKSVAFHKTAGEVAFMGAVMTIAQDNGIDISCYYDAQMLMNGVWNGLFEPGVREAHTNANILKPLPGFYALKYWGELLGMTAVRTECDCESIYATTAVSDDGREMKLLLSNFSDTAGYGAKPPETVTISLDTNAFSYSSAKAFVTDATGNDVCVPVTDGMVTLRGYAIALVVLRNEQD